jgi:TolA-binding protein
MALKAKIDEAAFAKLPKDIQAEYTKTGDEYILDVEGFEDASEMRRARDREKADAKELRKQLKEANEKITELSDPAKERDIAKIENGWKEKLETTTKEIGGKLSKKNQYIEKTLKDGFAGTLAAEISTAPTLLSKVIVDRLSVEFDPETDEPSLVIVGNDGKTRIKPEQLKKELTGNKEYASILIGSRASGSGSADRRDSPGSAGQSEQKPTVNLSQLPAKDLAAHIRARKAARE